MTRAQSFIRQKMANHNESYSENILNTHYHRATDIDNETIYHILPHRPIGTTNTPPARYAPPMDGQQ